MAPRKPAPTESSRERGARCEELACRHLERQGLVPVARNWRSRFGEIDLVLRDGETIVFVEVRFRSAAAWGGAAESIGWRKRRRLLATARLFLAGRKETACRFDVVLMKNLEPPEIEWIRDAIGQ